MTSSGDFVERGSRCAMIAATQQASGSRSMPRHPKNSCRTRQACRLHPSDTSSTGSARPPTVPAREGAGGNTRSFYFRADCTGASGAWTAPGLTRPADWQAGSGQRLSPRPASPSPLSGGQFPASRYNRGPSFTPANSKGYLWTASRWRSSRATPTRRSPWTSHVT